MRHFETDRGVALLTALIVMAIVAAMGLGLALTTSLEPLAAANYESGRSARLAAEAGVAVALHELAGIADWNLALTGLVHSAVLEQGDTTVDLPDGSSAGLAELTARANCGRPGACTESERTAFTAARPWGPNNPLWRVFGHGRLDQLVPNGAGLPPAVVVVWVSDDPAEVDGDPLTDSGIGRRRGVAARRVCAGRAGRGVRPAVCPSHRRGDGGAPVSRLRSRRQAGVSEGIELGGGEA